MGGESENCTVKPSKIKMLLPEDVIYQILLWLPVVSLLRFKCVCRSWHALIESSLFIKQHLHLHHYDPSLKDKNQNLIYKSPGKDSPFTFPLTCMEGFEEPNVRLQLNCSDLRGCFPIELVDIVSYDGIICLNLYTSKNEYSICLWNPATKQSRVLPQSPFHPKSGILIGFGYDIKSNDYKVVKLTVSNTLVENRFDEVYSLNTGCWRRLASGFSNFTVASDIRMPFNNGTSFFWEYTPSFFWEYTPSLNKGILCFDFSSEMFRCLPLPSADLSLLRYPYKCVVNDKIACVLRRGSSYAEMWVFNEYGTVNEAWTKLYTIDTYFINKALPIEWISTSGKYVFHKIFVETMEMRRFNVVTKETDCISLENMPSCWHRTLVGFKESLVSVGEENE